MKAERIGYSKFIKLAPEVNATLCALDKLVHDSDLDNQLAELVKIRVSQINGCGFCVKYHLVAAQENEVPQAKVDALSTWKDALVFDEGERVALEWAEHMTLVAQHRIPDALNLKLHRHFTEVEIVWLSVVVGTINHWNRLGVALRF
ncbi:carboxymuconolactone decarboxylase family protein [Pseudomonas fluorescens]|uniref:carboxymuconolactone decarboxylase family protein n=1 Tax=Pseudomonas fluorescens TaxID=294 RepID=UPI000CD27FEF|nr:carboxymuconolactone decarboxylase family protein [Pseudomonas fluorescens]PNY78784.1 alkylhydroperoxidase [Pseudomonas fluorescens]